jgi:mevalonate kinase
LTISETVVAHFSLTTSKSTGAGGGDESTGHLWKLFC